MPNVQDQLATLGLQTLADKPFCTLDSLILTQIVYLPLEGLLDRDGATATIAQAWDFLRETYPNNLEDRFQRKRFTLAGVGAAQPRYRDWVLGDYVNIINDERIEQFAALSAHLPDGSWYAAFRGTDLTAAGWKEDLNMAFLTPVPSQTDAVDYVRRIAARDGAPIRMGGHSKGGNLALYAGIYTPLPEQQRIAQVYSFDGPGLDAPSLTDAGYERIRDRVESVIPQSSVVGMLMSYHPIYTVVRSDAVGLMQHDALTWQVKNEQFEALESLDLSGRITDEALRQWLDSLAVEDRRALVEAISRIVDAEAEDSLGDLVDEMLRSSRRLVTLLWDPSPEVRRSLRLLLRCFMQAGADNVARTIAPDLLRLIKRGADEGKADTQEEAAHTGRG